MLRRHLVLALLNVTAVGAGAATQAPVLKDVNRLFPAWRRYSPVNAIGDVNGDGHLDVVFVANGDYSEVWLGSADSVFRGVPNAFPRIDELPTAIALADVDGDGDLDCVCAANPSASSGPGYQGYDRVFLNDGSGRFQPSPQGPFWSGVNTDMVAGDLDGDGDPDLVLGRGAPGSWPNGAALVFINDGTGAFTADSTRLTTPGPGTNDLALFDQDGDGDLDLYCGNVWGPTGPFSPSVGDQLFHNNGAGFFSPVPLAVSAGNITLEVHARDFDGDGDVDVITRDTVHGVEYRRNDAGTFTSFVPALPPVPGWISQLVLGDWNADGLVDLGVRYSAALHTLVQTTPGQFAPSALPVLSTGDRAVLAFDHDGDGDGDVIAPATYGASAPESEWFRNLGSSWAPTPTAPVPPLPFGSASLQKLFDVNGDGRLDVVRSPHRGAGSIWLGNAAGTFTPMPAAALGAFATPLPPPSSGDFACGDIDNDGDVDIVCAVAADPYTTPPTSQLYRNTAAGFIVSPLPLYAESVLLGDLDSDGDLDAVMTGFNTRAVLRNDGTGAFTITNLPAIAVQFSFPPYLVDLDGDHDLDIAVYNSGPPLYQCGYLANDGTGQFTAVPIPGLSPLRRVVAADFDSDGDVDLVADGDQYFPRQFLRNAGGGTFSITVLPGPVSPTRQLVAADVDGDGWSDLIEIDPCGTPCGFTPTRILRNDHVGGFTPLPGSVVEAPFDTLYSDVGDVDGDGDVDLMLASWHGTELYRNLHHQIAWSALPRVGRTLTLELYGRANEGCVLGLAFAPAAPPLVLPGIGTLRLDLMSLLIAAIGIYDVDGTGVFVGAVPNDPMLLGLSLYWQALSLGATWHLGNLETTTLLER
jgi:hypothetical protein